VAPARRTGPHAGFTLVEATIALALLVLLTSSAVLAARGGIGAFRATQDTSDAETRVRRALDRVVLELLSASSVSFGPYEVNLSSQDGTSILQFQKPQGSPLPALDAGGQPLYGPPSLLLFDQDLAGELDDGLDNNDNGLVDEGVLALIRDFDPLVPIEDQPAVILCRGVREMLEGEIDGDLADNNANGVVDEDGFNVHRVGDVLFVRLSVEEPLESGTIVRTLETSVRLRN
jgi:type II secretory pathway pseudopilin PulG